VAIKEEDCDNNFTSGTATDEENDLAAHQDPGVVNLMNRHLLSEPGSMGTRCRELTNQAASQNIQTKSSEDDMRNRAFPKTTQGSFTNTTRIQIRDFKVDRWISIWLRGSKPVRIGVSTPELLKVHFEDLPWRRTTLTMFFFCNSTIVYDLLLVNSSVFKTILFSEAAKY